MRVFLLVSLLSASLVLSAPVGDSNSEASYVEQFNLEPAIQDDSVVEEPNKVMHDQVVPTENEANGGNRLNGDGEFDAIDEQFGSFPDHELDINHMEEQPQNDEEHESNHGSDAVQEHNGSSLPHLEGHEAQPGDNQQQVQHDDYDQDQQQSQKQEPSHSQQPQQGEGDQYPTESEQHQNHQNRAPHGHNEQRPSQNEHHKGDQEERAPRGQEGHRPSQEGGQDSRVPHAEHSHPSHRGHDQKHPHRGMQRFAELRQHQESSQRNREHSPQEGHEHGSQHGEQDHSSPYGHSLGQMSEEEATEERFPHGDEEERSSHEAHDDQHQQDNELPEQDESREEPELEIVAPKLVNVNLNINA